MRCGLLAAVSSPSSLSAAGAQPRSSCWRTVLPWVALACLGGAALCALRGQRAVASSDISSYAAPDVARYSPALAQRLVLLSDAAYCGDSEHGGEAAVRSIEEFTCPPCSQAAALGGKLTSVTVFENVSRQTLGLAGVTDGWTEGDHIVVSFRGSVLQKNYDDDADLACVAAPPWEGCVLRGMFRSYSSLREVMLREVAALRRQFPVAGKKVLVTGHSLGAVQAIYAAVDLAMLHKDAAISLYAFAPPRPGDAGFAAFVAALRRRNLQSWVVAHRADTVPHCGLAAAPCPEQVRELGLRHVERLIYYPADLAPRGAGFLYPGPGNYTECDDAEDMKCINSIPSSLLTWADHDVYLDHVMYCCGNAAKFPSPQCKFPFGGDA